MCVNAHECDRVSYTKGRLIPKSNPYYGEIYYYLRAIHLAHSTEMMNLLITLTVSLFEEWEENGEDQPGKYTTVQLREQHLTRPWAAFSIGTFDGMTAGFLDLPLIIPSQQCQESWHKKLMRLCGDQLRVGTAKVLDHTLRRILLMDTAGIPKQLNFTPRHLSKAMLKKALRYLDEDDTRIQSYGPLTYVLRFKSAFAKLSKKLVAEYVKTLKGRVPDQAPRYKNADEDDAKEQLLAVIEVTDSMHSVVCPTTVDEDWCSLWNPAGLSCSCKGFRMCGLCSHVLAVTVWLDKTVGFDRAYLESQLEKLCEKPKRAAHRPRKTAEASRVQPHGDSASEDSDDNDGDDEEEDLDVNLDLV